jgi:hypothetical protein
MELQIDYRTTAREIIAAIDSWASDTETDREEACKLWAIFTALRGPDNENGFDKRDKTCYIRSSVLPNLANRAGADIVYHKAVIEYSDLHRVIELLNKADDNYHFNGHIRQAVSAILSTEKF